MITGPLRDVNVRCVTSGVVFCCQVFLSSSTRSLALRRCFVFGLICLPSLPVSSSFCRLFFCLL